MTGKREFYKTFYELPQMTTPVMAQVFGAIYRFCEMRDGICYASKETLGQLTGYTRKTVRENISKLIDAGWIVDLTPNQKFKTHRYTLTDSARQFIETSGTFTPMSGTFTPDSGTFTPMSGTLVSAEWNSSNPEERELKRINRKEFKKKNSSSTSSLNAEILKEALIYIQRFKSALMDRILNENENIEYPDSLERAIETHWGDMVYYALDGRDVKAGDFLNTDNILEMYHSASMCYMEPAFYETYFAGNYEMGLR